MYPLALFVYKRPELTRRTLDALRENPGFGTIPLYIFCDGAKNSADLSSVLATREVVRSYKLSNATIVERERNLGLAKSIIEGVTELCTKFGAVVVVEDDLLVSRSFLDYMNNSLARYENDSQVMAVAGHSFVNCDTIPYNRPKTDAVFLPFANSWGWATWHRAWLHFDWAMSGLSTLTTNKSLQRRFDLDGSYPFFRMLKMAASGRIDSWAIRWYLSIFMQNGLVLFPAKTLVQHMGHDGAGTHVGRFSRTRNLEAPNEWPIANLPSEIVIDLAVLAAAKAELRRVRPRRYAYLFRMALSCWATKSARATWWMSKCDVKSPSPKRIRRNDNK